MPFLGSQPARGLVGTANIDDDVITEAKMANDAIGLAELKAGTDGELISWDASGNPVAIGAGTSGHFLKSQGAGSQPVFAAAGGTWNIIGTAEASNSASLTITGLDSTYDHYAIGISDIRVATDIVLPWIRLGDSSGIDSGANDYLTENCSLNQGTMQFQNTGSTSKIVVCGHTDGIGNQAGEGFEAMFFLNRPGDGFSEPRLTGNWSQCRTANSGLSGFINARRKSVIAVDRIQFLVSSGNITSGRLTVWGIAHA
jgi:hypothetical protein